MFTHTHAEDGLAGGKTEDELWIAHDNNVVEIKHLRYGGGDGDACIFTPRSKHDASREWRYTRSISAG